MNQDIQILWDYMNLHQELKPADVVLVLGNPDIRTAERGAEVFKQGLAPLVLITGGFGKIVRPEWTKPEAEMFARRMSELGVPRDKMILETKSTNTSENFKYTRQLVIDQKLPVSSAIVVTKPYMERRAWATGQQQWPDLVMQMTSPALTPENYPNDQCPEDEMINLLVGDVQRMWIYAEKGWQASQPIPEEVKAAWQRLVDAGYTKELVKPDN